MSVSSRVSIRWLPEPASEPTSTLVLTSPERRFVDLRLTLGDPPTLYWGFTGTSQSPTPTSGKWIHILDSRSDQPGEDSGTLEVLENGDILEKGEMVDFDDGKKKQYEEVWRDEVLAEKDRRTVVLEAEGEGMVILVGKWCQGLLKRGGVTAVERWREDELIFRSEGFQGRLCPEEIWERQKDLHVGDEVKCGDVVWKVVERSRW